MGDEMEVDAAGVAIKEEVGADALSAELAEPTEVALDKVSMLQESVDKMALSMFNALRLLPASTGDEGSKEETAAAVRRMVHTPMAYARRVDIRLLANDVLRMVKETDALIDDLPGLEKTESDQLEELRRLQIQSEEEAQTLRQVAEEAVSKRAKMADKYGGRVYAGEDSEEDEEEEIEYSFQFGGFGATQSSASAAATPSFSLPAAPRFSIQAPAAVQTGSSAAGGEDSEEESDEETGELERAKPIGAPPIVAPKVSTPVATNGKDSEEDDEEESDGDDAGVLRLNSIQLESKKVNAVPSTGSKVVSVALETPAANSVPHVPKSPVSPATRQKQRPQHQHKSQQSAKKIEEDDAYWTLDASISGVDVMGDAILTRLQPSLDDSIHRIAELTENQQVARDEHSIYAYPNIEITKVAVVMDKLPHYIRKVHEIKTAMAEISTSVERMKKRAENLRVDAQSHAIKKENKRDAQSQWNKLYAAKSSDLTANGSE
ncbi:Mediator complex, subunit med21, partial [Globisporangium splendens]